MRKFVKEITALMKIRHPNLLLLMGVCLDGPQLSIITEFCDNSTLFYVLHKNKNLKLSLLDRFFIGIQIARGLVYLHQSNPPIIHRDLKPENCLLDAAYSIKIADFGLARSQINDINPEDTQENTTLCIGTTRFMAPELFDKEKVINIGCEIDIWSYGCLLIELFSGKRPWSYISSANTNCIYYEIFKKKPIPIPEEIDPELKMLIRSCCDYDPVKRPAMERVLIKLESLYDYYLQKS